MSSGSFPRTVSRQLGTMVASTAKLFRSRRRMWIGTAAPFRQRIGSPGMRASGRQRCRGLGALKPTGRPNGIHTAGTSSQIADGASAALLMTREKADALGTEVIATVVDVILVGVDPVLMLEGPILASRPLLEEDKQTIDDIDVIEINEAFASVVLAWQRDLQADLFKINPERWCHRPRSPSWCHRDRLPRQSGA